MHVQSVESAPEILSFIAVLVGNFLVARSSSSIFYFFNIFFVV